MSGEIWSRVFSLSALQQLSEVFGDRDLSEREFTSELCLRNLLSSEEAAAAYRKADSHVRGEVTWDEIQSSQIQATKDALNNDAVDDNLTLVKNRTQPSETISIATRRKAIRIMCIGHEGKSITIHGDGEIRLWGSDGCLLLSQYTAGMINLTDAQVDTSRDVLVVSSFNRCLAYYNSKTLSFLRRYSSSSLPLRTSILSNMKTTNLTGLSSPISSCELFSGITCAGFVTGKIRLYRDIDSLSTSLNNDNPSPLLWNAQVHTDMVTTMIQVAGNLVTGSWDGSVKLLHVEKQIITEILNEKKKSISSLSWNPDKRLLATTLGGSKEVVLLQNSEPCGKLVGHTSPPISTSFNVEDQQLYSLADDTIRVWDIRMMRLSQTIRHSELISKIQFDSSTDRLLLAGHGEGQTLHTYQLRRSIQSNSDKSNILTLFGNNERNDSRSPSLLYTSFLDHSNHLLVVDVEGTCSVIDICTGLLISSSSLDINSANCLLIEITRKRLLIGFENKIIIFNYSTNEIIKICTLKTSKQRSSSITSLCSIESGNNRYIIGLSSKQVYCWPDASKKKTEALLHCFNGMDGDPVSMGRAVPANVSNTRVVLVVLTNAMSIYLFSCENSAWRAHKRLTNLPKCELMLPVEGIGIVFTDSSTHTQLFLVDTNFDETHSINIIDTEHNKTIKVHHIIVDNNISYPQIAACVDEDESVVNVLDISSVKNPTWYLRSSFQLNKGDLFSSITVSENYKIIIVAGVLVGDLQCFNFDGIFIGGYGSASVSLPPLRSLDESLPLSSSKCGSFLLPELRGRPVVRRQSSRTPHRIKSIVPSMFSPETNLNLVALQRSALEPDRVVFSAGDPKALSSPGSKLLSSSKPSQIEPLTVESPDVSVEVKSLSGVFVESQKQLNKTEYSNTINSSDDCSLDIPVLDTTPMLKLKDVLRQKKKTPVRLTPISVCSVELVRAPSYQKHRVI